MVRLSATVAPKPQRRGPRFATVAPNGASFGFDLGLFVTTFSMRLTPYGVLRGQFKRISKDAKRTASRAVGWLAKILKIRKQRFLYYAAVGRFWYGAKYSYGVWERFARQANTFLRNQNFDICVAYLRELFFSTIMCLFCISQNLVL